MISKTHTQQRFVTVSFSQVRSSEQIKLTKYCPYDCIGENLTDIKRC